MKSSVAGFNPEYGEDAPTVEQVRALAGYALLDFGTPWCGHCQAAEPAVREAMLEHSELLHIKVYDGKGKTLGRAFTVKQWPTLVLLRDGVEETRLVRPVQTSEVRRLLAASKESTNKPSTN